MNFNSIAFGLFFGIVFLIYWKISDKYRWVMLLAASCYFYIGYGLSFFVILSVAILISYLITLLMNQCCNPTFRKLLFIGAVAGTLMFLGYYKYYFFLIENMNKILNVFVIRLHPATAAIALPVGISFYSFKILGYVIDVYRGGAEPEYNLGKYALFIMFFPEISSGPIDRGKDLLPQFSTEHIFNYEKITYGLKLVSWGLFKKIIIADGIAYWVDSVYSSYETYKGFVLFIISIFYTIQIYCDFSGYSDMAVGMAKMLDIDLCNNFKNPYFSSSIKEFWRRWHISLSLWLRDYIYIPLGGSKKGKIRTNINLMLTFLLSGLWHGADWSYIVWGGAARTCADCRKYRKPNISW